MTPRARQRTAAAWALLAMAAVAAAQQQAPQPQIGYVYPAGGKAGTDVLVTIGGRNLGEATGVRLGGEGIRGAVHEQIKLPNGKEVQTLRDELKEFQARTGRGGKPAASASAPASRPTTRPPLTAAELKRMDEIRTLLMLVQKRRTNPALAENLVVRVTIAADARPGRREIRLQTPGGLSNPMAFYVGTLGEFRETESEMVTDRTESGVTLPVVLNGQIMPGDVDRFKFAARKGQRLVVSAAARELVPYISDAVPGWFQAVVALYDSSGKELAYADHHGFRADPMLLCEIPADGDYVVEVRDSIYRGREDFVYRVTVGELPYITGVFPLGGRAGVKTPVAMTGWNLPAAGRTEEFLIAGVHMLSAGQGERASNAVPFAVDTLPECMEKEPNDAAAQPIALPVIVNGRIDRAGDVDAFRFEGHAGDRIVAEVVARRLDSPLDSVLKLTGPAGKVLAANDDREDKAAALETHHADSLVTATLPADGTYTLHLADTQHKGGPEYAYRLRVSVPRPDFVLRVTPSSVVLRRGGSAALTVHALRTDGFEGEIALVLKDAPNGFTLGGTKLPAKQDSVRVTLSGPPWPHDEPIRLNIEGRATIDGRPVAHPAVPADDMQQAFSYRHLVPAGELTASVVGKGRAWGNIRLMTPTPVKLPLGGTAKVRVGLPLTIPQGAIRLELAEPPEGVSIASVSAAANNTCEILFAVDAKKAKPNATGNLIVNILVERKSAGSQTKPAAANRRVPAGTLPAIPFKITPG